MPDTPEEQWAELRRENEQLRTLLRESEERHAAHIDTLTAAVEGLPRDRGDDRWDTVSRQAVLAILNGETPYTLCNEHAECIELRRDDRERRLEAEAQLALANESLAGIEQFYVDLSAAAGRVLESADCYADGSIDDLRDALGGSEEPHDDTPDVARNIAERYAREHR